MKRKSSIFVWCLVTIIFMFALVGCGSSETTASTDTNKTIKFGVNSGNTATEVFNVAAEKLKAEGYTVKLTEFNDYITPNKAVEDGTIDYNFFQHIPYLKAYNENNGNKLAYIGTGLYNLSYGIFSINLKSINDVKDGMKVGIQNDPTNRSTSLHMLQDLGLIKLKDGVELPTLLDIVSNPKHLNIIEMDEASIVNAMKDLDIGCVCSEKWVKAGNTMDQALISKVDKVNTMVVVTTKGNENSETAKKIDEAMKSAEVKKFLEEHYKGVMVPLF
ncbi:MetQ/NlpA family ABC transporter substrate-binding protein [Desulfosporosinus sp. OT]|uniref:MetQ/NlpA family ABC transporter substrate-binding protein n=1 Tax=Desulfosporosinus sp. OT TaxID=913865 RepID=UPI0002239DCE|nr:MetQ/NlpA family ABC transporter substrate-binding protein [Desulfosporosinus sp. OT]EGW41511.1 NLPA lipofamily protein [Desulfosporosinus sp. OT]